MTKVLIASSSTGVINLSGTSGLSLPSCVAISKPGGLKGSKVISLTPFSQRKFTIAERFSSVAVIPGTSGTRGGFQPLPLIIA